MAKPSGDFDPSAEKKEGGYRGEVDTSAPFESVKEAVSRFGGVGYWKPTNDKLSDTEHDTDEVKIATLEEQMTHLEKDLIAKERETLDVLKDLESTKQVVEELKLKLQKEVSEVSVNVDSNVDDRNSTPEADKENQGCFLGQSQNMNLCLSSTPGLILVELKQAKLNLTRTTNDIADIRASIEWFTKKLEKERCFLEKTRERLTQNSSKISSLEEELNQTRLKLRVVKEAEGKCGSDNPLDLSKELQRLSSEAEQFKKMGEATKAEVLKAISDIEQTKAKIKTAEIRLLAARKMKEAARAAEAVAIAEIKVLSDHESQSEDFLQKHGGVTLSYEEYSSLTRKAQEAEEFSKRRVIDTMQQVDEANLSKMEILKQVEEATEEVRTSKKALEAALNRVEAANRGKLAVEEALRKWRSEHCQRRRSSVHNSTRFKNSGPIDYRREPRLLDVNGLNLVTDGSTPILKPTLSIGQILSRKLLIEDFESGMPPEKSYAKRKVSLGQMLNKENCDLPSSRKAVKDGSQKPIFGKRKKFGFAPFSMLLAKQTKKKKATPNLK